MDKVPEHVRSVCKIGQGQSCCRYLVVGERGFECAKLSPPMRVEIDARVSAFTAQGDNCEGVELETDQPKPLSQGMQESGEKSSLEAAYNFERGAADDMRRLGFAMAAKLPRNCPEVLAWLSAVQDCHLEPSATKGGG